MNLKKILKDRLFQSGLTVTYISRKARARHLKVNKLRDSDTFMCSYPRSGNTWTRMIVACLLDPNLKSVDLDVIDEYVPQKRYEACDKFSPRVFKRHAPAFDLFPKVIYNYRDGRDCILSAYRYACRVLDYKESFEVFLFDADAQVFGFWHRHVRQALDHQKRYPDRILFVSYESLSTTPHKEIQSIANFLGITVSNDRISEILDMVELDKQKKKKLRKAPGKEHALQTRSKQHTLDQGRVGGWREAFPEEYLALFEAMSFQELQALGYEVSLPKPENKPTDVVPSHTR